MDHWDFVYWRIVNELTMNALERGDLDYADRIWLEVLS